MAYLVNQIEDEDKDKGSLVGTEGEGVKQLSTDSGTLETTGGAKDVTEIGTGQVTAPAVAGGQDVSTQQKYLEANKAKSLQLAGKTAGVVKGDIDQATAALTAAGEQFKTDVGTNTVNLNQDLVNKASGLVDQAGYVPGTAEQFLANQADVDAFKKMYNAEYGGPTDITTQDYYTEAAKKAAKAQRDAELIADTTGRQELISRTYDNPTGRFSAGTLALDEALLSGNEDAYNQLLNAAVGSKGIEGQMTDVSNQSQTAYESALAATEATKEAMRNKFNLTGEESEIKTNAEAIKAKAKKDYEDYLKYIQDTYGVQEGVQATSYYDRPQDYINIAAQNVASKEDYARLAALESLTGGISTLTPYSAQAGQYSQYINPAEDFRASDFLAKVSSSKASREAQEKAQADALAAQQAAAAKAAADAEAAQKKAVATTAGVAVGAAAGFAVAGPVGAVVGAVIGGVLGAIFCFDEESEFEMVDGSYKKMKDIKLGDILKEGGKVYSISQHILKGPLYSYPTQKEDCYIWVTGNHAVKEDGKWIRVANSRKASLIYEHEIEKVSSLSCENHIMISHGVMFADFDEINNSQGLTDEQCLKVLNS